MILFFYQIFLPVSDAPKTLLQEGLSIKFIPKKHKFREKSRKIYLFGVQLESFLHQLSKKYNFADIKSQLLFSGKFKNFNKYTIEAVNIQVSIFFQASPSPWITFDESILKNIPIVTEHHWLFMIYQEWPQQTGHTSHFCLKFL